MPRSGGHGLPDAGGSPPLSIIDVNAPTEWGMQPILDAIPASCGVLKMKTTKPVGYNHVYYFFKDLFSSTLVGMVIDPFFECKLAFVAFDSVERAERVCMWISLHFAHPLSFRPKVVSHHVRF